jgi:hypothetical protein
MIHRISCLAVSGAFKGMTRDQMSKQLALIKINLLS